MDSFQRGLKSCRFVKHALCCDISPSNDRQSSYGPFRFAVQSLKDSDFVSKSFAGKDSPVLSSQDEILSNVFWRFLQLRGYITEKHELTPWGESLNQALSVLDPADNLEEAIFLAIELLRLGLLNSKQWFSHVSGGPMRGSGKKF